MLEVSFTKQLAAFTLRGELRAESAAVALLGASGSGKSMMLKCIAGVETPDSGRIVLDGRVLFDAEAGINLPPQARKVGLLFQNYALFPTMTVQQNILCGLRHLPRAQRAARCAALLEQFHLDGFAKRMPLLLSGGQQQRVALARMLASEPQLLLFDEPFSALDSFLRWELEQTVAEVMAAHAGTSLFVSHNYEEAYRLCSSVAVMEQGCIEVCKSKNALALQPETCAAARLIGCENIASAVRQDENTLTVPAWGVRLRAKSLGEAQAVGIPAAALRLGVGENAFSAQVVRVIECTQDALVLVRTEAGTKALRLRADKRALGLREGDMVQLSVAAADLYPLRRGDGQ